MRLDIIIMHFMKIIKFFIITAYNIAVLLTNEVGIAHLPHLFLDSTNSYLLRKLILI